MTNTATTITSADPGPCMDEPIRCPQRVAPARIAERFRLGGTAGPAEHLKTGCASNPWLIPLAETLAGARPDSSRRPRGPRPLEPVLMQARRRHGAAAPQPGRRPR